MNKHCRRKMKLMFNKSFKSKKTCLFTTKVNKYHIPLKKKELLKHLRDELSTSTTHGLSYFGKDRIHYLEKFFWVANFVACMVLAVLLLNVQYIRFMAAPTVMSVEMNYFDWNISYPAITLCPLYKPDVKKFQSLNAQTFNYSGLSAEGYLWAISQAALDTLEFMDLNASEDVVSLIHPKDYAKLAASMFREFQNSWLATNTNWPITVDAAMTEMGMCHVINSNVAIYDDPHQWNSATVAKYVKKNIELSVFEVDFFTEIKNYSNIYKVFIHSPEEVTTSTTSSFNFDVEGTISFGVSVWSSRISDSLRYKSLYLRKCRFHNEPISKRYPIYSYGLCILECRIKMIQKICGCVPHFYKPLSHERICYIAELTCILKYRKEIITLETSEETFKKFNNAKELPRLSRDCGCLSTCEIDLYYKDTDDYEPSAKKSDLKIKITSFPKVRIMRDIIFNSYDIVLRSGGVINLCIGSSVMSMVEFLLTILKICISIILSMFRVLKQYVLMIIK